jgi:hypothetical protein
MNAKFRNFTMICLGAVLALLLTGTMTPAGADGAVTDEQFFTLQSGTNLRAFGGPEVRQLLFRKKGGGTAFGSAQRQRYCALKNNPDIQWTLMDMGNGKIISCSDNADELFFGASTSKIFVAATLLDKQDGELNKKQLILKTRMIVRSDNGAWRELQRQCGNDGSDDAGRRAVHDFVRKMGYEKLRGFQGWMKQNNGNRLHGNELNSREVAQFLYDTCHNRYPGAEILWKIMHATRTGRKKVNKYTPRDVYIAGKTGTYHGPNESRDTIRHAAIKAHNHAVILNIKGKNYGLVILGNTGRNEDVAVLGGGLMREYLGIDKPVSCDN